MNPSIQSKTWMGDDPNCVFDLLAWRRDILANDKGEALMSKILALMPFVRSHCVGATVWCAILIVLGMASVALNWTMNYLLLLIK